MHSKSSSCFLSSLQNTGVAEEDDSRCDDKQWPHGRINFECSKLDAHRQAFLFHEKLIGHCIESSDVRPAMLIAFKRTNFRWQWFNKIIGQGKYGRVFTAMNLDTGQLMAVKQVKYERQDHQAIQALVDEIKNVEGIRHPNLVRYYGVEVHTDELLIFMEYCSEGTLEQACRDGLCEELVRGYTRSLLKAVCELHRQGIVHRDIKPANIFLTSDFCLKLGDFGCTARLKSATNTGPGELTSYIGTAAYMAPEVCAGIPGGYGRTCDIWSLGCVVLEMITGKPPWHEYHFLSIIYKVGNGGIPPIPENISDDCRSFLDKCLVRRMEDRWPAERLMEHQFVKVFYHHTGPM
ncbi:unnamed protein product [Soboliphyme baturini]|uniref:Protein kinase domain-containing protein n=1 Tax=Soboliphyme baturini TaxID=241478 RepID=A0A183I9E8_9BILA|nr:unnamed protein product [Soboliphyme baturini]